MSRSGRTDLGTVGLVGAGRMGAPMAANLARAGLRVSLWNRSGICPRDCAGLGIPMAESLVELGRSSRVLLTVLPDLPDVQQVCDGPTGLLAQAEPGAVVVVLGTVSPPLLRQWADTVTDRGFRVVDAPVSGGVEGARAGTLSIMVGGEAEDVAGLPPLFDVLGSTVRHLGPLGSGQGAESAYQHKDLGFVLETAREAGVVTPVSALVDQLYGAMRSTGRGQLDHSAVIEIVELLSGDRDPA